MALIRMAYASEATFSPQPSEAGVEPNVARILMVSRRNNPRRGIVGGLYYGNNQFFQCLEGDEDAIRDVYYVIRKDTRHRNVKTLIMEPLSEVTFSNWTMKYVPMAEDVSRLLKSEGLDRFEPAKFSDRMCEKMIGLIRNASETGGYGNRVAMGTAGPVGEVFTPGVRYGLVAAGVSLVAALVIGGVLLL